MKISSYGNFQVGIVDDPSIEDKGGFEFASGMDIFSEPGVLKAAPKMVEVTYNAGNLPVAVPTMMVDTDDGTDTRAYIIAGSKVFEMTTETTTSLFHTNTQGANLGLAIFNGYVFYAAASKLGRALVGNSGSANDTYQSIEADSEHHPMIPHGGTLKFGAGRYVSSLDEGGTLSSQALKLPVGYRVISLSDHLSKLFAGTRRGTVANAINVMDASVFDWRGTVLATGSALPDTAYPMKMLGMRALISDGHNLFGFPGNNFLVMVFDGVNFSEFRRLTRLGSINIHAGSVTQHVDSSVLFTGEMSQSPGIYQMKNGAICQAFVPSSATPGEAADYDIGFVKSSFGGKVLIGYKRVGTNTYHIEHSHASRHPQNNAVMRTLWHKADTDKLKRWYGIKLNLKPMAANTVVTISYRTERDGSFTSVSQTLTPSTQDKPIFLPVQPRSREIQFKAVYTTSGENGPELLSYDLMYEPLNSTR